MNYRLEQTDEGPRWIKLTYNRETEKIEREPLPVGETITLDPKDFHAGSEIAIQRRHPIKPALKEDGTPYTFEEFLKHIEDTVEVKPFKPFAFYNKAGDILQVYWDNGPSIVKIPEGGKWDHIELHVDNVDEGKIMGVNIWNIRKILMEAFADE